MHSEELRIEEPCSADWDAMDGDARRRFCGQCRKHVHDLSAMTSRQAVHLVTSRDGLCVRYAVADDGRILHRRSRRTRLRAALGAMLAVSTPAMASTVPAGDASDDEAPSLIERVKERVVEWLGDEAADATETLVGQRVWKGEVSVEPIEPKLTPPPERPRVLMGAPRPRRLVEPEVEPVERLPTPPAGESVIPEVQQALDAQRR